VGVGTHAAQHGWHGTSVSVDSAKKMCMRVVGDGSAATVAQLVQALSRWAKPRRGQTADALRCVVTAATG